MALVAALLAPVLSASRTILFRDSVVYSAPCNAQLRASLLEGRLLEWDSSQYGGVPFLANPSSQALYPPRWAAVLAQAHPAKASDLFSLLHLLLALAGACALGRELGLRRGPRHVVAVTYTLSGYLLSLLGNGVYLSGAAWLPLGLAWVLRARRKAGAETGPAARALGLAALGVVAPFLGGDPQGTAWLGLGAVLVFLAPHREAPPARRAALLTGLGGLAFLLGAILLLPALGLTPETTRSQMTYAQAAPWSFHPARLGELLVPFPLGLPAGDEATHTAAVLEPSRGELWSLTLFLGAAPFLLVLLSLGRVPTALRRARLALWVLVTAALFVAFGRHTPLHPALYDYTPYRVFRYPEKHLALVTLALAGLAGVGLQAFLARPREERLEVLKRLILGPLATLAAAWLLHGWSADLGRGLGRQPPAYAGQVAAVLAVQLALLALLALARLGPRRLGAAVLALVALTQLAVARQLVLSGPSAPFDQAPESVRWLRERPELQGPAPGRVQRWGVRGHPRAAEPRDQLLVNARHDLRCLTGAVPALYGLESMTGMTGFYPKRALRLLSETREEGLARGSVAYRISPRGDEAPSHALGDFGVFALPGRPRVELLAEASLRWEPNADRAWRALREVDLAHVVVEGRGPASSEGPARRQGEVQVEGARSGAWDLRASTPEPALLVIRDAWFPGWSATLDEQPVELLRVDGVFMGVRVPAGEHRLALRYRTPGLQLGAALSLGAWLVLASLGAMGLRRRLRAVA